MSDSKRIPRAWSVRLRMFRQRAIPVICFSLALWSIGLLWQRQERTVEHTGEVRGRSINLVSPSGGFLTTAGSEAGEAWESLDHIDQGQLFAKLNPAATTPASSAAAEQATAAETAAATSVEIRAPFAGTLTAVYVTPGQAIAAGTLLATLVEEKPRCVICYLDENERDRVEPGMAVALRERRRGALQIPAVVESVGKSVEPVPPKQALNPNNAEWGIPVRIRLPETAALQPGMVVEVLFSSS